MPPLFHSSYNLSRENEIVQILALSRSNDSLIDHVGSIIEGKWQKKPPAVFCRTIPDSLIHLEQKADAHRFS